MNISSPEVEDLVPVARAIAHRTARRLGSRDRDELVGAALEGLVEAARRFDATRGVPFRAYAQHRIQGAVVDAVRSWDWVPRSVRERAEVLASTRRRLADELDRDPTTDEVATELGISADTCRDMIRHAEIRTVVSLDAAVDESVGTRLIDLIASEHGVDSERIDEDRTRAALSNEVAHLPERERTAIRMFYLQDRPLKEVAGVLGVSEGRVSQLCAQAIRRMRTAMQTSAEA